MLIGRTVSIGDARIAAFVQLEFADSVFDAEARDLRRRGETVPLSALAFELLRVLIERRPNAVSHSELKKQLWPDSFVGRTSLAGLVAEIRKAVGDDAATPRLIRNHHSFGYSFCGDITNVADDSNARRPAAAHGPLASIAVLPFVFLTDVDGHKGLSLGFADAIITILGNLETVAVATTTSAIMNYGAGAETSRICRDLGVRYALQGTVQKLGTHWRVSVQLFDATTERVAFAERHHFQLEDVFDVQDEIGRRIAHSLERRFPLTAPTSRERYSTDPEAYAEFMAGLRESYGNSLEELDNAARHLAKAVERDPEFALAHAWLSHVAMQIYWNFDSQPLWLETATDHCQRALKLEPTLPEGQWANSAILWSPATNFQHADAIAALEHVLAARPNFDRAHNRMAAICLHIGRLEEARIAHDLAVRSNPRSRTRNLEWITLCSGDFARADEAGNAWVRETPHDRFALWFHPQPPLMTGRLDIAEQRLRVALEHYPDEPLIISLQGMLHACRQQAVPALDCVRKALDCPQSFGHTHHTYEHVACVYSMLGDTNRAFGWLQRCIDSGNPCWPFFQIHPCLQNLRRETRFEDLMCGLQHKYAALQIRRL